MPLGACTAQFVREVALPRWADRGRDAWRATHGALESNWCEGAVDLVDSDRNGRAVLQRFCVMERRSVA